MTTSRNFERDLRGWLREDSENRVPDHLADVLLRTAATDQRRWWSSPRRWLPVDLSMRAPLIAPTRLTRVVVVVVIIVALIATAIFFAGSRQRRLPPPFGPARNGTFITGINGDLFTVDPTTGARTGLASNTSTDFDFGPGFSRDGTRLFFLRIEQGRGMELVVADADGRDLVPVTPWVDSIDQADWSPDGSRIVYRTAVAGRGVITVVNADGTNSRTLDLPLSANTPSWLPPDGGRILFRREHVTDADPPPAIMTVAPDGSGVTAIKTPPASSENDLNDVSASPDGTRIIYREVPEHGHFVIHILDLATGKNRVLPEEADGQTSAGFSPDGTRVVYLRFYPAGLYLVVAPADGSSTGTVLPLQGQIGDDGPTINNYFFTPNGSAIIANELTSRDTWLLPIDGSPGTILASGVVAYDALTTVQRLAP
jgi:dipeptidyl aminopeptidase/acylaminoacyl peptidase